MKRRRNICSTVLNMSDSTGPRRSGRRTIRPLDFWNFEKPDDSKSEKIIYNVINLSKCSIYDGFSTKYYHVTNKKSTEDKKSEITVNRVNKGILNDEGRENDTQPKKQITKPKEVKIKLGVDSKDSSNDVTSKLRKDRKKKSEVKEVPRKEAKTAPAKDKRADYQQSISSVIFDELPLRRREERKNAPLDSFIPQNSTTSHSSQNQTAYEQPSFQNILSSTVVDPKSTPQLQQTIGSSVPLTNRKAFAKDGIFKVPKFLPYRSVTQSSTLIDFNMVSIPEELETDLSEENTSVIKNTGNEAPLQGSQAVDSSHKHVQSQPILKSPQVLHDRDSHEDCIKQTVKNKPKKNICHDRGESCGVFVPPSLNIKTSKNESLATRRSGRIRTKPLEFWNFETVEVKNSENGEVSVVHHKQVLHDTKKKIKEDKKLVPVPLPYPGLSRSGKRHSVEQSPHTPSLSSSLSKRKLYSSLYDSFDETAEVDDEHPSKRRSIERTQDCRDTPQVVKFKDLKFNHIQMNDYKCYFAKCIEDKQLDIYSGFMFLEWGKVVWNTTRETNLYVLDGCGTLHVLEKKKVKGRAIHLKQSFNTTITSGKKLSIKKDGRSKMLKLFLVFSSRETSAIIEAATYL